MGFLRSKNGRPEPGGACAAGLLLLGLVCFQGLEAQARSGPLSAMEANRPLWQSIFDYEEKYAFEEYGPPMKKNLRRFQKETRLYEDMAYYFDEAAEDEPDFTFIVEAYSVPVGLFRPTVIRPEGEAEKDSLFGEDDPLPEATDSTSVYVEDIRPTYLPGGPLKPRHPNAVSLGSKKHGSLFAKPELPPTPAMAPSATTAAVPPGAINAPKKKAPLPGSNEETLMNLKKAVRELGLERKINFDAKQKFTPGKGEDGDPSVPAAKTPAQPVPEKPGVKVEEKRPAAEPVKAGEKSAEKHSKKRTEKKAKENKRKKTKKKTVKTRRKAVKPQKSRPVIDAVPLPPPQAPQSRIY